jgi:enterochelin esterase-like enzyme
MLLVLAAALPAWPAAPPAADAPAAMPSAVPAGTATTAVRVDRSLPWVTARATAPGVAFRTFRSRLVGTDVSYHVYVPPGHDAAHAPLPVLYWLHGTEGGIAGIPPLSRHFAAAMRDGSIPEMLVVFVNGLPRRLWADSADGSAPVESVFVEEVIADVDASFRTRPDRQGRILEGFSMGGYGAARIGFRHPELFAGVSILAGGPFDLELEGPRARRSPALVAQLLRDVCSGDRACFRAISPLTIAPAAAGTLRAWSVVIRQAVGDRDDTAALNRGFHERMAASGIAHDYVELPGVGHQADALLQALGEQNGRFYRRALGIDGAPGAGATPGAGS